MAVFSTICSAYSNTQDNREKDADSFISTFKSELLQYKQLEESNISGLTENLTVCTGETLTYEKLYSDAFHVIDLINVHFNGGDDITLESSTSSRKQDRKAKGKPQKKEDAPPQPTVLPSKDTVELIVNAFVDKGSKSDYSTKYGQLASAWCNPECNFSVNLLHRLLFAFMRCKSNVDSIEQLKEHLPEDPIVKITAAVQDKNYEEIGAILATLTKEQIAEDYVFFNQLAGYIWKKFTAGDLAQTDALKGTLNVYVNSPAPCPMQTALVALKLAWFLDSQKRYDEAAQVSESALTVIENFRDVFAVRKSEKILSSSRIPSKPLDQHFLLFEKWLSCLHTDVLTILFRSKLNYGLQCDEVRAKENYERDIESLKAQKEKTREIYGTLSLKQQAKFEQSINKQFRPPVHAEDVEKELLERFKSNRMAKALIYVQMSFFRPSKAQQFLEKAREIMREVMTTEMTIASPIIYVNRTEAAFIYCGNQPESKQVAMFGKESSNSSGLTLQNTALQGTGVKQDKIEPFIITGLKPNTAYTFGFAAYDAEDEVIDTITDIFSITTTHPLYVELIWSYIASASFQLQDMASFDVALSTLLGRYAEVCEHPVESQFYKDINPFNRFTLKSFAFEEPAPLLQAFSTALLMAARLFSAKPLHATAFHKLALELSQVLQNSQLTLQICTEMFTLLQPVLANSFHARWVVHPLLFILTALKTNKATQKDPVHQDIIARCAFELDAAFAYLYQERQLSVFIMNSILETPPNPMRTAFLMFASRYHLLESSTGDSTLPLAAADLFRSSPEKAHDDLNSKFKADPNYLLAATYLVANAHTDGLVSQGVSWSAAALENVKGQLSDIDEKNQLKKGNKAKEPAKAAKPKKQPAKKDKKEVAQNSTDDVASIQAATKIAACWTRYNQRQKNLKKFFEANKYRAALNMLQAMCMIEQESAFSVPTAMQTERSKSKRKSHKKDKSGNDDDSAPAAPAIDNSTQIITLIRRAIVLAVRANDPTIVRSTVNVFREYIRSLQPGSSAVVGDAPVLDVTVHVLIELLPLEERFAQLLFQDLMLSLLSFKLTKNMIEYMCLATKRAPKCGVYLWILAGQQLPEELQQVQVMTQRRDPAENLFYQASDMLNKEQYGGQRMFPDDLTVENLNTMIKAVDEIAINLQHKQRLAMSCTLLRRLAFLMFQNNQNEQATQKLLEALECHFRTVNAHEKVDQILADQTEEKFYQTHSWSGCISIFTICSLLALNMDRPKAMMLSKLASFALSALFTGNALNPTKAIDFANYEPSEIIPGIDIFSQFDPAQPLLEPIPAEYLVLAISNHLSSLLSYEMYFEMFKPLSFARHYFRFIVRNPRLLIRARLFAVQACAQFGLIKSAVDIVSSVTTSFGFTRRTKEFQPIPSSAKRFEFNENEPAYSTQNLDCIKQMTSSQVVGSLFTQYGMPITSQYIIGVSRILQSLYETNDPEGNTQSSGPDNSAAQQTAHKSHKKSHHSKKDIPPSANQSQLQLPTLTGVDIFDQTVKAATQLVSDYLQKEFRSDQTLVKAELQLELALLKAAQWSWEAAISNAQEVISSIAFVANKQIITPDTFSDRPLLLPCGMTSLASQLIGRAAYNIHDYATADRYGSPYTKALVFIHKADIESAALLLAQIAVSRPVTMFYPEYFKACGQLLVLYCYNHKLVDVCTPKVPHALRPRIQPQALVSQLNKDIARFYTEQLGLKQSNKAFIRGTHLIIRLMHLDALVQAHFGSTSDSVVIIQNAIDQMRIKCPFISHGLMFLLCATSAAIQVKAFMSAHPTCIQFWNQEINPLQIDPSMKFSPDTVGALKLLIVTLLKNNPDCVVHPMSGQAALDLVALTGLCQTDLEKRLDESMAALKMCATVRSAARFVQSFISTTQDVPPTNAPIKIINDNKDASMRGLAAAYYSHIIELSLPIFDTSLLEERTLSFFKCFEDQCAAFKLQTHIDTPVEQGDVAAQWYLIDARAMKVDTTNDGGVTTTIRSMRSGVSMATSVARTTTTSATQSTSASAMRKKIASLMRGNLLFCIGIAVESEESRKKRNDTSKGLVPFMLAGQPNELKSISDELSGIGLDLDECKRSENTDTTQTDVNPKDANDKKQKKNPAKPPKPEQTSSLKGQSTQQMRDTESKWTMAVHKAQATLTKSARLLSGLSPKGSRYSAELHATNLDINAASNLSKLMNQQFGINAKSTTMADWIANEIYTTAPK